MKIKGIRLEHQPVLVKEAIELLAVKKNNKYIDTTLGGGGHAEAILKSGGELLALDYDPEALENARKHLVSACPPNVYSWRLHLGNFAHLEKIAQDEGYLPVSGILFDLGISTVQLKDPKRGFSFTDETKLDMRMNPKEQAVTAADLVNGLNEGELNELFYKLGEEPFSRRLAHAIISARRVKRIETGRELAEIIVKQVPGGRRFARIHPATKVFQALRIAVNDELTSLKEALPQALRVLETGGRIAVISFHSLEDRIVKNFFREQAKLGVLQILTKKPIIPGETETYLNPSARSGKLRAAIKL